MKEAAEREEEEEGGKLCTLFPLLSIHNIRFFSSMLNSPAFTGMMASGGIWVSPGPTFIDVLLEVDAGSVRGRASPGRMRFGGGSSVNIDVGYYLGF